MNDAETRTGWTGTNCPKLTAGSSDAAGQAKRPRRGRWTLLALVIAVFFSMGHFAGAYQKEKEQQELRAKTIISEKFELRGSDDKLRAWLSTGRDGEVYLMFFDQAGRSRLRLGLNAQGSPVISFADERDAQRMSLALDSENGTPQIILFDGKNSPAIHLGEVQGFGPHLTIGKEGESQITAFLTADGSPSFQILDQTRKPRIALGVTGNEPSVSLLGGDGIARAVWRVLPDGAASLAFADNQAKQRLIVATDKEGRPSIRFMDANNNVVKEFK